MSTYYESYIFIQSDNDELEYIGPYSKEGRPCPLFQGTEGYVGEVVGDVMYRYLKSLKIKDVSDSVKFLGFKSSEENPYGWGEVRCTFLSWDELDNGEYGPVRYGYIYKTLKRNLEISGFEKNSYLTNYYDEEDDIKYPGIICVNEFEKLSPEDQKKYHFETWDYTENGARVRADMITVFKNWFDNVEYDYKLYEKSYQDIVVVSVIC
ncbi:hypothetical protein KTQ89_07585 [Holdemanella porci]|uniref:hypothetical protein n=1 Tax=Holdemanella porci TaxID=2652276 RepID=UPI001C2C2C69|nr:hypothetical protein [Holdemanella porci]MBU9872217.1 hypothetical protein [Holdemanella porci]